MSSAEDRSPSQSAPAADLIGPTVRAAREAQGMSLRELARRIGVSPSFVSQLERNKANASVSTLYALVDTLGLSLDQLMVKEPASTAGSGSGETRTPGTAPLDRMRDTGRVALWPAVETPMQPAGTRARIQFPGVVWERLTQASDPLVDFLHVEYAPGSSSCAPDNMMRHGGREYGYVIAGRIMVQIGFDHYELSSGDAVTFDSMTPHRLSNPFSEPCQAVWVVVGRRGDERGHDAPAPPPDITHLPSMPA
ncbi:helix-turn-helix domain-containing protein [Streptomyces cadmiisoli]|uniref:XRE family transcriptional regulator n=1 Tax=Streptomyces cadmiisoli TaxID=2184053 RepID=A0A2Z4ISX7_9ACTN|nr:XRE family transcriptional regulator [Streptomyces cadmiisoli]AWW35854.1 XRE family transcriptional regulator [Streptomyces cadmiisoli]